MFHPVATARRANRALGRTGTLDRTAALGEPAQHRAPSPARGGHRGAARWLRPDSPHPGPGCRCRRTSLHPQLLQPPAPRCGGAKPTRPHPTDLHSTAGTSSGTRGRSQESPSPVPEDLGARVSHRRVLRSPTAGEKRHLALQQIHPGLRPAELRPTEPRPQPRSPPTAPQRKANLRMPKAKQAMSSSPWRSHTERPVIP